MNQTPIGAALSALTRDARALTDARLTLYVTPAEAGWAVKLEGDDAPLAVLRTQAEGLAAGRHIGWARETRGLATEVRAMRRDGTFSSKGATYGPPGSDPTSSAG